MESNWTRGVVAYELVGSGAGLAARVLTPGYEGLIVTNRPYETPCLRAFWILVNEELIPLPIDFPCELHFPYGLDVEPP